MSYDIDGLFPIAHRKLTIGRMTNARLMIAIEEVLTATSSATSFRWTESREDDGLHVACTPDAPDWVEPEHRDGWELAHAVETWVADDGRSQDLRGDALMSLLCYAIQRAADVAPVRSFELGGLAA